MTTIDGSMRALEIQGTTVPKLGFGTWQIEGPECQEAVEDALAIGYRHIDTARLRERAGGRAGHRRCGRPAERVLPHDEDLARGVRARRPAARGRGLAAE